MVGWVFRNVVAVAVTPQELERARTWLFRTVWAQALSQAEAHGYRRGWLAATDEAFLRDADRR